MTKKYLQCGYEDECKKKDCMKCRKKGYRYDNFYLSLAERIVIEDFAVCDLEIMQKEKPEILELMQNIMRKIMVKVYKEKSK